jgi:hypothetical protein
MRHVPAVRYSWNSITLWVTYSGCRDRRNRLRVHSGRRSWPADLQQAEVPMVSNNVVSGLDSTLRLDPADLMKASPGLQLVYETARLDLPF